MSLALFNQFLESATDNIDQIANELEGYRFETKTRKSGKTPKTYIETIVPKQTPASRKSALLDDLVNDFYPGVKIGKVSAIAILNVWTQAVQQAPAKPALSMYRRIYTLLQPFLELFYPNRTSIATAAVAWRKPIRLKYGDKSQVYKDSIIVLGISRDESINMKVGYMESVRKGVRNRGEPRFTMQEVYDAIDATSQSSNPIDNIIAVMLACGSRMIEVIKISEYSIPASSSSDPVGYIRIKGLAKGTDSNPEETNATVVRPLVRISPDMLMALVQNIRSVHDFKRLSNTAATGKVNNAVNQVLKPMFKHKITSHKCRYLYASLAWQLYGGGTPQAEYIRELYNHRSADTTLTYLQYEVAVPKFHVPEELRAKVGELEVNTKGLKQEQEQLKQEVKEVAIELNRGIEEANVVDVQFPQFLNTKRLRLSSEAKMDRLRRLDQALYDVGIHASQRTFKKYGYGSTTVQDYYKVRPEVFA